MEPQMLDVVESREQPDGQERREPPAPAFIPGWRCLRRAVVRAEGEEGFIDLVALHPARGAALIALLQPGEEASPEEARAAFRTMLDEAGFAARFSGELPVVALAAGPSEADQLAAAVERSFAALPRLNLAEDWVDWLAERLTPAPADAEPPRPRLVAPVRDEVVLSTPAAVEAPLPPASEPALDTEPPRQRGWLDWGVTLGFVVGIAGAVIVGLAMLTHAGGLF